LAPEALPAFLDRLASAASDSIMPYFRAGVAVENKRSVGFDPVTAADREAEGAMRRLIEAAYPDHGVIGEEYGADRPDAEFVWVLDPIDGTRSFIAGLPLWGVLIGLLHAGKPVAGMMAQPFTGERFGGDGARAWYAGPGGARTLRSRPCTRLSDALLLTTTPLLFKGTDLAAYSRVESSVRLARYGTDCYGYCMVAMGNADIVVETGLQIYDIVALIPIIEGAGGAVTDWRGESAARGGQVLATGDRRVHEEALAALKM
jgi:histidinol phosphatase-like enzyme (inositol monophosphatase family)